MIGLRKVTTGITVVTLSLILLITASNSMPNGLKSVDAASMLAAAGDWGCSSNTKNTVNNIIKLNAPTTLSLGDNSYGDTATCWFNIFKDLDGDANPLINKRIKIAIGNHDDDSSSKLNSYKNHFNLNKLYYSFNRGGGYIHVLVMNSEDPNRNNKDSDQYKFVKSDLENARNNPNVKWIIVQVHKPFFSSPNGCGANDCKGSKSFTETYQPLFDQNKVDLVLFGHVHNYQRTFPLKFNPSDPLNPTRIEGLGRCDYTNPPGTIYAIVGVGGDSFHPLTGTKASFVGVQQAIRFGHLDISFSDGGNKLTGQFLKNPSDPSAPASKCLQSSSILDRFTITKTSGVSATAASGSNENMGLGDNPF